jgi:hypothetical protein
MWNWGKYDIIFYLQYMPNFTVIFVIRKLSLRYVGKIPLLTRCWRIPLVHGALNLRSNGPFPGKEPVSGSLDKKRGEKRPSSYKEKVASSFALFV